MTAMSDINAILDVPTIEDPFIRLTIKITDIQPFYLTSINGNFK